ncbi:hypothetical protein Q7P37_007430 [Cladosporium fusiforme]
MPTYQPPNEAPNPERKIVIAFDAYGTLLSTESVAQQLSKHFGEEKANTLATAWRKYQLEYTWRLNSMGVYKDFSYVTLQSLKNALAEQALELSEEDLQGLLKSYDSLSIFPDVSRLCGKLRTTPDIHAVVFSNGTQEMVTNSVTRSADLKDQADVFRDIVTVEEVQKYKPAREVYTHLAKKVGLENDLDKIWLVSGNPFDIVGARTAGLNAIWVNRRDQRGWEDGLMEGEKGRPTEVVTKLDEVVPAVLSYANDLAGQWSEFHGEREE